jgi:hypothetical protein
MTFYQRLALVADRPDIVTLAQAFAESAASDDGYAEAWADALFVAADGGVVGFTADPPRVGLCHALTLAGDLCSRPAGTGSLCAQHTAKHERYEARQHRADA